MLKKIFFYLFSLGIIFLLIIVALEFSLRGAGAVYLFIQGNKNKQSISHGAYRILCVGESTTALGGESAYPAQLERLLNERSLSHRFKVINKGIPGQGSAYIAENIKAWVDTYAPHMIIIMMGINDGNERIPVDDLMRQEAGLKKFLVDLRVYKLCRWVYIGLKQRFVVDKQEQAAFQDNPAGNIDPKMVILAELALQEKEYVRAERLFLYIAKHGTPLINWKARMKLHQIYFATDNVPALLSMVDKNPLEAVNVDVAMRLCKDRRYFSYMMDLLNRHLPEAKVKMPWYDLMGGCLSYQGLKDQAKVFIDLARQEELSGVGAYTRLNYMRILDTLVNKPIQVVAMQYPLRLLESLRLMLRDAANYQDIIFLGNESNFQQALMKMEYDVLFADRFAGDFGHCTPLGNRLIAENVADAILEKVFKGE